MCNKVFIVLLAIFAAVAVCNPPKLYIFSQHNYGVDDTVNTVKALIDQGASVGYNGLVIADYKLQILASGYIYPSYKTNINNVISYAKGKGWDVIVEVVATAYADAIFQTENYDYSLAEPVLHQGAQFVVSNDGSQLIAQPCCAPAMDGGFENTNGNTFTSFNYQDPRITPDHGVVYSGGTSVHIGAGGGNARLLLQNYQVAAFKMYHVQVFVKTSGYSGGAQVTIVDAASGAVKNFNNYNPQGNQDWTPLDFVFNTLGSTSIHIYMGNWGGSNGDCWLDQFSITEYPLFNVVQRNGAPFNVYDPNSRQSFAAGTDYNVYSDPSAGNYENNFHNVPPVTIPSGSSLRPGQVVMIDYYGIIPAYNNQIGSCLSHPTIDDYINQNAQALGDTIPAGTGVFFGYDEMRHLGSCSLCAAAAPTSGQLLANHVQKTYNIYKNHVAGATFYYWSDMFDPNHNAVDNYFYSPTTVRGSWNGLPGGSIIFNWMRTTDSLNWFHSLGLQQVVSGYYDSGDGYGAGSNEAQTANGVANVLGHMYTTWYGDYSQLNQYAQGVLSQWNPPASAPTSAPTSAPSQANPSGGPAGYIGCYQDADNRDLPFLFADTPSTTVEKCQYSCGVRGYQYAGLQYYNQCFCGNNYGNVGKATESDCNTPCNGNNQETCGGGWRNSVYATGDVGYKGCFVDSANRDIPDLIIENYNSNGVTIDACRIGCSAAGYAYAGLQNGGQCFCGNSYGGQGQAPDSDCGAPCAGDNTETCGGGWRNKVYTSTPATQFKGYTPNLGDSYKPTGATHVSSASSVVSGMFAILVAAALLA